MFSLKLRALGFPHWKKFDSRNEMAFRTLVVWLEETKIRHYSVGDRATLRKLDDGASWSQAYSAYLSALECPHAASRKARPLALDWMLRKAISLEYSDRKGEFQAQRPARRAPAASAAPRCTVNLSDPGEAARLKCIASALGISSEGGPKKLPAVLSAVSRAIHRRLTPARLAEASKRDSSGNGAGLSRIDKAAFDQTPLGFSTSDPNVDRASKLLRMLYISRLREVQTRINRGLAEAQELTANPKTDSRLGRVGYS